MARRASVRYWTTRKAYCCWHNGRQHTLASGPNDAPHGPTYLAALAAFGRLLRAASASPLLSEVAEEYLKWHAGQCRASTTDIKQRMLRVVCATFGQRYACSLSAPEIEGWAAEHATRHQWSDGTRKLMLDTLRACLRYAVRAKLLTSLPFDQLRTPQAGSRGMECVLAPEQKKAAVDAARPYLRDVVIVLRDTGARPGEILSAERRHYDPALGALILPPTARQGDPVHKTARTGKARVICLNGESRQVIERLCERHPTGKLFRHPWPAKKGPGKGHAQGWTTRGLSAAVSRLGEKIGVPGLIPYSFRHTYAVEWLRSGAPIEALAELLGTSVAMIRRHYGHLGDQWDYLRRVAERFSRDRTG